MTSNMDFAQLLSPKESHQDPMTTYNVLVISTLLASSLPASTHRTSKMNKALVRIQPLHQTCPLRLSSSCWVITPNLAQYTLQYNTIQYNTIHTCRNCVCLQKAQCSCRRTSQNQCKNMLSKWTKWDIIIMFGHKKNFVKKTVSVIKFLILRVEKFA